MRRVTVLTLVAVASVLAGCGGDSGPSRDVSGATAAPGTAAVTTTAATTAPAGLLADQHGVRYCEVLTVTVAETGTRAEVWGTQGLNDCPQAAFAAIDPAAVAAEMGVTIAVPNGPRYWVLDGIVANALTGSGEIRDFGGMEMRSIATVDLGRGIPDRSPYIEISVLRDTEFAFDAGREVYELGAPDGSAYVMQSYSLQVDPTLTAGALAGLDARLQLPAGWSFTARTLDERLVVEDVAGVATVVQDELQNSYQLLRRG